MAFSYNIVQFVGFCHFHKLLYCLVPALNASNGQILWTTGTSYPYYSEYERLAYANGILFTGDRVLTAFNASNGNILLNNSSYLVMDTNPVVADGMFLQWMFNSDPTTGQLDFTLYAFTPPRSPTPSPTLSPSPSPSPTPSGTWISPSDGFSVKAGTSLQLSANAYPAQPNSSIRHVNFASNWNGSWRTVCITTSSSNTFGCNWNLEANGVPVPNGAIQLQFTVYDSSGTTFQSPSIQGTITPPQVQQQISGNWAGYVVTGQQYTMVKGSWIQPAISCGTNETSYAYFWVGLGGVTSTAKTLEQIGTAATCQKGKASYFVWYEMVPNGPGGVTCGSGLKAKDKISLAEVTYLGGGKFNLAINTPECSFKITKTLLGAAHDSAEWIAEAPCQTAFFSLCVSNPWPKFGSVTFTGCSAGGISIASGPVVTESMMTYGLFNSPKGQPSSLNSNNTGFSVKWVHA